MSNSSNLNYKMTQLHIKGVLYKDYNGNLPPEYSDSINPFPQTKTNEYNRFKRLYPKAREKFILLEEFIDTFY